MLEAILNGLGGLIAGFANLELSNVIMILIGFLLLYLGIKKDMEPLLLLPIGFGAIMVNIPLAGLMEPEGFLKTIYDFGIITELFPLLIFIGVGAMTDFGPVLANPYTFLLGAAGQLGIFVTLFMVLSLDSVSGALGLDFLRFSKMEAVTVGIIGACDGPTVIYVASQYARDLLGPVSVAAYSYMSLVPLLQPPIMKALTTKKEREIIMKTSKTDVSKTTKILFPIVITILGGLIAPKGLPLLATIMLGNLLRESGVVPRLAKAAENEIANIVTLLLGITIGATMSGPVFVQPRTLVILALGFIAICLDTVGGVLLGKFLCFITRGKINPLIGAAGISAFPMAARVAQKEGFKYNKKNYLLMHAMGANAGGQIGSVMAAAVMLSVLKGMGII
ncbi:MAG: sodium ion-translocating decarboxylase subunit beta [Desulfobacteraceae bacterium]|nr:MAG: sodium ion-translocating decarboxylase subunit beta [Desulfobacteraceae bacterium]